MLRFDRPRLLVAGLVGAVLLAAASPAQAAFVISLTSGSTTVNVADGSALDSNSLPNVINYVNGNLNGFEVNVTIRTNSPGGMIVDEQGNLIEAGRVRDVTLTTRNVGSGSGTLTLDVLSDGFTIAKAGDVVTLTSSFGGDLTTGSASSATFTSTVDSTTTSPLTLTPSNLNKVATSSTLTLAGSPFTVRNQLVLNLAAGGEANLTGTTTVAVPAPAGLVLALSCLPVVAVSQWIRRRRPALA